MSNLETIETKIGYLDRDVSTLRGKFETHQKHVNNDISTFRVFLDPQTGLMSVVKELQNIVNEINISVAQLQTKMLIIGVGCGVVTGVITGLIVHYLTK